MWIRKGSEDGEATGGVRRQKERQRVHLRTLYRRGEANAQLSMQGVPARQGKDEHALHTDPPARKRNRR